MPLNSSGTLSIGGSTAGQSINLELGRAATASSDLNESALRTLAGVASGQISISNFYGKANDITSQYFLMLGGQMAGVTPYNATQKYSFTNQSSIRSTDLPNTIAVVSPGSFHNASHALIFRSGLSSRFTYSGNVTASSTAMANVPVRYGYSNTTIGSSGLGGTSISAAVNTHQLYTWSSQAVTTGATFGNAKSESNAIGNSTRAVYFGGRVNSGDFYNRSNDNYTFSSNTRAYTTALSTAWQVFQFLGCAASYSAAGHILGGNNAAFDYHRFKFVFSTNAITMNASFTNGGAQYTAAATNGSTAVFGANSSGSWNVIGVLNLSNDASSQGTALGIQHRRTGSGSSNPSI